jgi:hypothetical protein
VREVWVAGRKVLASLYQQMRDPCWVVGIDRPRDANEPAQVSRVTYRHDSYGFDSGTHGRRVTRRNPSREALRRNRDYSPQLLPIGEITTSTSSKFFSCNIVFIFIQVNLVTINPSNVPILGGDAGNIETDASQFHSVVIKDLRQISSRSLGTQCLAPSIIRQSHLFRNHASCH